MLTEKTSWDDHYNYPAYVADALTLAANDGDKEVGSLVSSVETILARWEELDVQRRQARRKQGRTNALIGRRDVQADDLVKEIHNDVLAEVKQDRKHPLFIWLFPSPVSGLVRLSLASELPELRKLATKLAGPETPAKLRDTHAAALQKAIEQGDDALASRMEIHVEQGRVMAQVADYRDDVNRLLLGIEGALKQIASKQRLGQEWVDAFFPQPTKTKKKADE